MAAGRYLYIKSNDGAQTLYSIDAGGVQTLVTYYDTDEMPRGLYDDNFPPPDNLLFDLTAYAGLATTVGATIPDVVSGTSFYGLSEDVSLYVIEGGGGSAMLDVTYNGSKIIDSLEVTPPVTVTHNGSTIATLNAGDTKTLQCNGKVMASDVVIGDKTLQCSGKLMASDVVVEVGG